MVTSRPWTISFDPGKSTLAALLDHSLECDFAAVFLTGDDAMAAGEMVPRDNCIFELGLFVGAFGTHGRCFTLTSLPKKDLPSDVRGYTYIKIDESSSAHDNESIEFAASKIVAHIREIGRLQQTRVASFSQAELMEKERPTAKGGALRVEPGLAVVVNSAQPIESVNYDIATQVVDNMKAGVEYEYFLRTSTETSRSSRICY